MDATNIIFQILILIMSVVIHEVSHGFTAYYLGDPTAKLAGRLTLNPIKHLDPLGSVVLPALLYLSGTHILFGWAKPVPYNPYNLKDPKWGGAYVAIAGPVSNFLIALCFGLLVRFRIQLGLVPYLTTGVAHLITSIILLNIVLALFNLIPVAPLDGSKILFAALPYRLRYIEEFMTRYQLILVLVVIFVASAIIDPLLPIIFHLFTGLS